MRVGWISFLDAHVYSGGGERNQRTLIDAGRARGHEILQYPFLRRRFQRAGRRLGLAPPLRVDWSCDAFMIGDIRNAPAFPRRMPEAIVDQALATGRAAVFQEAWVDVCPFDVPCDGDTARCRAGCVRSWADRLYSQARAAIFNSPMQRDVIASVIGVPLPDAQILSRPAIDVDAFRALGLERDIEVLYVGTINEAKGYGNLIERFGTGTVTFAGPNGLGHPVEGHWLGPVAYADLPLLYNRARVFAHLPAWLEPMGRAPVEAALCGCELVLNDRVGVASYPREEWTDPEVVRGNASRFWEEFEAVFG